MKSNFTRLLLSAVLMMCCMAVGAVGTKPSKGDGTTGDPYQIATKDNLLWFADYVNQGNLTVCAILTADITVNSNVLNSDGSLNSGTFETWTPIGNWGDGSGYNGFAGEFNGSGHTISGLYFNDETRPAVGLFGMADNNGYIHDVGIKDSYFRGKSHVAGICGDLAKGKIENCWNAATIQSAEGTTGGIAGSCWKNSSVSGCYNIGKVAEGSYCGGICGSVAKNNDESIYSVSNCVSLEGKCDRAYNIGEEGAKVSDVYILDASKFANGEACWILNDNKIDTKWRQQIGTDSYPVWTGNYLVNHSDGKGYYNETMCEKENGIHNFEKKEVKRCDNSTFVYWHCNTCDKDFTDADRTREEAAVNMITHFPEYVMGIVPTETTKGCYGYYQCTSCHKKFKDELCSESLANENELIVPEAKNTEIWYTTTDSQKLTPYKTSVFGATYNDANNVYERGLGKITFDKDVTSIGEFAFSNCSSLQSISVPNSVTSIGNYAFSKCSSLQSISVPNSVTSIGNNVFSDCSSLQSISVPNSVTSIGNYVFSGCSSLQSISVPNSVTSIGERAFMECSSLQSISVPNSVTSIGNYAFSKCSSLKSISVPNSVTSIGNGAFYTCSQLQSITIPGGVKSMGNAVFSGCTSLEDVTIEDGAYIGNSAFQNYNGTLTINGSLSGVGEDAFENCTVLTSVSIKGGNIRKDAFKGCVNLGSVTLHDGVTSIGEFAFSDCSSLKSISVPNSVNSIGQYAFSDCSSLKSISVPNSVNSIGQYAFGKCSQLQSITIPGSVKSMGTAVFSGCTSLSNVTIEDGAYIGDYVFQNYTGSLTINGSLSGVGQHAFENCLVLKSVSIKSGGIGELAFKDCTNLITVSLLDSVKSMGYAVFSGCTSLSNVTIEDGAYIGDYVFQNYTGSLTINGSLSGVGERAFQGCPGLTSVSFESGNIGLYAFDGCKNICTITLQKDVTGIDGEAFAGCVGLKDITVKWTEAEKIPAIPWEAFRNVDKSKVTLHIPSYTTEIYKAKDVWNSFNIVEDINFIITKTDDTKIEQKVVDNGSVTIDERSRNIKSLVVSEEVENVSVTYIRNFANAGKWQAWYVPFDVSVSDMDQAGLDVAEIYGILLDKDNNAVIAFLKMDAGTVKANTPYVVRPKEYGDVTVTTTTTLYQTKPTQFAINSAKDTYTIGGIYEQTTTPGNWYAVNTSGQFQKMGTGVNLSPMRIWMTIDPRDDNPYTQPSEANAKMNIMVIGDDESIGIESLTPTLSEGNGVIYNLQGQRVTSIQKGQVYIMNGKKFFAR